MISSAERDDKLIAECDGNASYQNKQSIRFAPGWWPVDRQSMLRAFWAIFVIK